MRRATARVLLRVVSGLVLLLYVTGVGLAAALLTGVPRASGGAPNIGVLVLTAGAVLLVLPAVTVGAVAGLLTWEEPGSRAQLRRVLLPQVVIGAVGAALQLAAIALGVPVLVALGSLLAGAFLSVSLIALGRAAGRRDRVVPGTDPAGRAQQALRRGVRRTVVVVGVLGVVVLAGIAVLAVVSPRVLEHPASVVLLAVALPAVGGGVVAAFVTVRISRVVREVVGSDIGRVRRVAGAVLRGKSEPLSAEEQHIAVRYAEVIGPFLRAQLLMYGLLFAGTLCEQASQAVQARPGDPLPGVLLVVFAVLLPVVMLQLAGRFRRLRGWTQRHPESAAA